MNGKSKTKRGKRERYKITPFRNPSGETVWRISGTKKDGNRVRANYKTEGEATTAKGNLEREDANMAPVPMKQTKLSAVQLGFCERAVDLLRDNGKLEDRTIFEAAAFYVENYRPPDREITLRGAVDKFIAEKKRDNRRARTVGNLKARLDQLVAHFPAEKKVSETLTTQLKEFLHRGEDRASITRRNDFLVVSNFFRWATVERFCAANPCLNLPRIKFDAPEPAALPVEDVQKLMKAAQDYDGGKAVPWFALALFAGIRPAELNRLTWANVDLAQKVVVIGRQIAKTRSVRNVELEPNVIEWLTPYADKKTPIPITRRAFEAIRRNAKLSKWQSDILRHSAISNHFALHRSASGTSAWAGNSENVIFKHYRFLLTEKQAKEFWAVYPTRPANVVKLTKPSQRKAKKQAQPTEPQTALAS